MRTLKAEAVPANGETVSLGRPAKFLSQTDCPRLLTAADLANILRTSVRSVRRWDSAGRLPAPVRIGSAVRWRTAEIEAWLASGAPRRDVWHWSGERGRR